MKTAFMGLVLSLTFGCFSFTNAQYIMPNYSTYNYSLAIQQQMQSSMLSNQMFNQNMANEMLKFKRTNRAVNRKPASNNRANNSVRNTKQSAKPIEKDTLQPADSSESITSYKSARGILLPEKLFAKADPKDQKTKYYKDLAYNSWNQYQYRANQNGLDPYNMATAMAYLISSNYMVYKDSTPNSLTQRKALFEQIQSVMQNNPQIAKLTDEEKQIFAEGLVFMSAIPVAFLTIGEKQKDQKTIDGAKSLAAKSLESILGANFDKLAFTDDGLSAQ
ncbi:MAG: hypothetical protein H7Z37_18045 [Pyrinomonadaceae bacterium]|nr:hypothetical protein [Pyrinomonadaceae bacterium]